MEQTPITNASCGVMAWNGYKINATENGVTILWKGYDGNDYKTKKHHGCKRCQGKQRNLVIFLLHGWHWKCYGSLHFRQLLCPSATADDAEHYWWVWSYYYQGNDKIYYKAANIISSSEQSAGTLGSVMTALTDDKGTATLGLLSKANGGDCDNGGYIRLKSDLDSKNNTILDLFSATGRSRSRAAY